MNRNVVGAMVTTFYAVAGRNLQEATLPAWERICDDLPDAWVRGEHLANVVALDLLRNVDGLVTPRQFRAAYIARAPRMGHADSCQCEGTGWLEVDSAEDRWTPCRGPMVALPESPPMPAIGPADPDVARRVGRLSESLRERSTEALAPAVTLPRMDANYFDPPAPESPGSAAKDETPDPPDANPPAEPDSAGG